jgi:hypothetical protein
VARLAPVGAPCRRRRPHYSSERARLQSRIIPPADPTRPARGRCGSIFAPADIIALAYQHQSAGLADPFGSGQLILGSITLRRTKAGLCSGLGTQPSSRHRWRPPLIQPPVKACSLATRSNLLSSTGSTFTNAPLPSYLPLRYAPEPIDS